MKLIIDPLTHVQGATISVALTLPIDG